MQGAGKPVQGSCSAVGCCRAATAGLRRRGVGEWRPDNGVAYGLKGLAQKEARGSRVLTGASGGRRRRADGSSAGFGGGIGAVAVDGVVRGSSGLLGRTDR